MAIEKHTVHVLDGSSLNFTDKVFLGQQFSIAYTATANATYNISFTDPLPPNYSVFVALSSASSGGPPFITAKTAAGFTITIPGTPTAGVMDVLVVAS